MDGLIMLKTRRSIRKYKDKDIPDKTIKEIVDSARLAPSANNLQPWLFVVIKDKNLKQQIAEMTDHGKFIKDASCCIAVFCKNTKYYLEDGSAATENILLAAWYFGIGSCWVAGDKKSYAEKIRELLGLKKEYKLVSLVSLGYPDESELERTRNVKKKQLEDVIIMR